MKIKADLLFFCSPAQEPPSIEPQSLYSNGQEKLISPEEAMLFEAIDHRGINAMYKKDQNFILFFQISFVSQSSFLFWYCGFLVSI